ncbi:MAG: hypothetical protein IKE60_34695 [Reyranella sp.]|uniref:hypothetical protein n=1 Tax=Reyranella sp. TaxID=1929291 RepID=UPI0025CF53A0|nr:hypothetical protein [Reyranella sp.]MBR2819871.1 hypothetical protein [Reyranella sp.]
MAIKPKPKIAEIAAPSVVDEILASFVGALASEEGMAEIAARLKAAIVEKRSYAEASLRAAMFDDGSP